MTPQMPRNLGMIGHRHIGRMCADKLVAIKPGLDVERPFWPPPFNAIHIHDDRPSPRSQIEAKDRRIVSENKIDTAPAGRIAHAAPIKRDAAGGGRPARSEMDAVNAVPVILEIGLHPAVAMRFQLAIDIHLPAFVPQLRGQLASKGLKPTMRRREPSYAQNIDGFAGHGGAAANARARLIPLLFSATD